MGNRDEGDDLYQESLVSALTGFGTLKKETNFRPWLYRIIINRFKNQRRNSWWKKLVPLTTEIAESIGGENPAARRAARHRLEIAFQALNPDDKALITLYELEGWRLDELAVLTGRSAGSLKVRISRSKKKMRERLSRYLHKSAESGLKKTFRDGEMICVVTKPGKE